MRQAPHGSASSWTSDGLATAGDVAGNVAGGAELIGTDVDVEADTGTETVRAGAHPRGPTPIAAIGTAKNFNRFVMVRSCARSLPDRIRVSPEPTSAQLRVCPLADAR
jgi:hypothetical protein